MLLFNRRTLLIALLAAPLGACGFEPVYREGSASNNLAGNIKIDLIDSREGFELTERLRIHLGDGGPNAPYCLKIDLNITEEGFAVSTANVTTRLTLTGTAHMTLCDTATGDSVFTGTVTSSSSYNATTSTLSTTTAKRSAVRRIVLDLADKINLRLAVTAKDWAQ